MKNVNVIKAIKVFNIWKNDESFFINNNNQLNESTINTNEDITNKLNEINDSIMNLIIKFNNKFRRIK